MTGLLVVLVLTICPLERGQPADVCDEIEIRAASCSQAAAWGAGWVPAGWAVVSADCRDERMAAR